MAKIDFTRERTYGKSFDGVLKIQGHVSSEENLPLSAESGDIYLVGEDNALYIFNGEWKYITDGSSVSSDDVDRIISLTQSEYDGLSEKDPKSLYIMTDTGKIALGSSMISGVDGVGVQSVVQTTVSQEDGGTNVWTITLTNGQTSTLQVKNGNQGNSGYSGAAGELEVVNNLVDGGATSALSAEMGKTLNTNVSQLRSDVSDLDEKTEDTIALSRNLANLATVLEGLYLSSSGTITSLQGTTSIKFPCKASTTYTISKIVTNHFRVAYYSVEPVADVVGGGIITSNAASSITITTANNSIYIVAYVNYTSDAGSKSINEIMSSLQIEEGSTATEYTDPGWSAIDKTARRGVNTLQSDVSTLSSSVSKNTKDIVELDNSINASEITLSENTDGVNTGKYRVSSSGNLANGAAYFYTDPIKLHRGDKIIVSNANIVSAVAVISEVDSSNNFVSLIYAGQDESASYTYITDDEILVGISAPLSKIGTIQIVRIGVLSRLSTDENDIEQLEKTLNNTETGLETTDVTTGAYWNSDGYLSTLNGYFHSKPIKLHKGDRVTTDTAIPTLAAVSYVTKVDAEERFLAVLKAGVEDDETINVTIGEDCYVSISAPNTRRSNFIIYQNGIESRIDSLASDVANVSPDAGTRLPAITTNPLAVIRREAGYGLIIRKWGIIGDSLSSGEMQCFNNESASSSDFKFVDMYQYSTGQVLARLLGASAYNFSNGGQTAWGWLKSQGNVHDESYIGGVGGGDWRLAQQSEYLQDGYIIALGVNDRTKILNGDYELGTTSQITTYNGTDSDIDDTTTYPKSFARYYAGIIQRILSVQPKAKIFCVTPLGDNYAEIAQAIRDIVTYFGGNVYLMDIRTYIPEGYNVTGFKLNGHLSPMGYAYWAYMYNTYIDWIIRNNGAAFRDTALIGTNYRPDYS